MSLANTGIHASQRIDTSAAQPSVRADHSTLSIVSRETVTLDDRSSARASPGKPTMASAKETRNAAPNHRASSPRAARKVAHFTYTHNATPRKGWHPLTQPSTHGTTPASSGSSRTQGNRLDPWYDVYADQALNLRASEIRALFSVVSRPEVVSLAGGMPNLKDLPLDKLAASAEKLIRNHGAQAMQYGNGQGWEVLREHITEVMSYDGIVGADPDDVVVTTGSQQALDLVTELFVNPGDVILAEAPSYVGALGVFRARQADVVHVPMDEHGIIPEALAETIRNVRASGRTIKFI